MRDRPNIVLFLTDDHGAWALGCYGNGEIRSPELDALAQGGARFANAFTPCPVCSPARACLMTGRTPSQVGIHDWLDEADAAIGARDWLAEEVTLPGLLQQAGYHTGLAGKWHLGRSHGTPKGFDWCFGLPGPQGEHLGAYTYHLHGRLIELTGNKTCITTDYACRFLDEAPADRPFFLNVGYITTHSPYEKKRHDPTMTAMYDDADFHDIPPYRPHPWHRNEGLAGGSTEQDWRQRYQGYYAAVSDMDRNVGRIIEHLRKSGRLDNTLIIYTADHGCALGHQGYWGKGNSTRPLNMYETSLRVPLVMRHFTAEAGGRRSLTDAGHVVHRCVDHYDTFTTLCAWAGVDRARLEQLHTTGDDYGLMARGERLPAWNDTRCGEYGDLRMIRTPEWKLVRRYPDGPDELFDMAHDAGETRNLAGDAGCAAIRSALLAQLEAWYAMHETPEKSGLRVKQLPKHNASEAWRDGLREARGLQVY